MKLLSPFQIGSRLLPTLNIGGAAVSLEMVGCRGDRAVYRWYIDFPAGGAGAYPREFSGADLEQPGTFKYLTEGFKPNATVKETTAAATRLAAQITALAGDETGSARITLTSPTGQQP